MTTELSSNRSMLSQRDINEIAKQPVVFDRSGQQSLLRCLLSIAVSNQPRQAVVHNDQERLWRVTEPRIGSSLRSCKMLFTNSFSRYRS